MHHPVPSRTTFADTVVRFVGQGEIVGSGEAGFVKYAEHLHELADSAVTTRNRPLAGGGFDGGDLERLSRREEGSKQDEAREPHRHSISLSYGWLRDGSSKLPTHCAGRALPP